MASTGYGPSRNRLLFDGDKDKYSLWEVKFMAYLRLQKLVNVIMTTETPDEQQNAEVYAELVQLLDDRSLNLVMRDAENDGRKAIDILREHYRGVSKPRVMSLYSELTSLKMAEEENTKDFVIRAETAASSLRSAGETISDSLLVCMLLKSLPAQYQTFSTIITQREKKITFSEFKVSRELVKKETSVEHLSLLAAR